MERFHRYAQQGGHVKQEQHYGRLGPSQPPPQQSYHTLRRSRSTPEDSPSATALPAFAAFLQQSPPRRERGSFASSRPEPSTLAGSNLAHPRPRDNPEHRHRLPLHRSSSPSAFASASRLLDAVGDALKGSSSQRSAVSDASGGSPNINEFKSIAIHGSPPVSQRNSYPSSQSRSSSKEPARTRTSYKPSAASSGGVALSQQQQQQRPPARTSRYLREIDRRNILRRIEQGEKQANLAKEYQVSRAAISNLKQRRSSCNRKDLLHDKSGEGSIERGEPAGDRGRYLPYHLLQQMTEPKPGLHHHHQPQQPSGQLTPDRIVFSTSNLVLAPPNRHRHLASSMYPGEGYDSTGEQARSPSPVSPPSRLSPYLESEFTSSMEEIQDRVVEVKTATMELLLTRLLDPRGNAPSLRLTKSRIARLLLESAMSEFPTRDFKIPVASSASSWPSATASPSSSYFVGTEFAKPTCAVEILADRDGRSPVLLKEFQQLEPFSEVGSITLASESSSSSSSSRPGVVHLPQHIHESNVLLLVDFLDLQSSEEVASAIQVILQAGVQQRDLCLGCICSHERALRHLLELFPPVRIVTAKSLAQRDPRSPDIAVLLRSRLLLQ